jgi:hypothetical protein
MWRYVIAAFMVVIFISTAHADSTKQMPQFDSLTTGAADDTIWVYDASENSLKRMTTEELMQDYLGIVLVGSTNQVLRNDGTGGVDWTDFASVSGTGVTTIDTDSGSALSVFSGGANRIGIVGGGDATVTGSGNTVTVTVNADLTAITNASAFSGETDFALDSEVTAFVTARTNASAFSGETAFALNSELTSHTDASAFTGETNFVTSSDGMQTTEVVYGGVSKWFVYSGTTLTADMLAGGMLFVHTPLSGSTPTVIGVPDFSASTPYFGVWDMTGGGVRVQTTDGDALYYDDSRNSVGSR